MGVSLKAGNKIEKVENIKVGQHCAGFGILAFLGNNKTIQTPLLLPWKIQGINKERKNICLKKNGKNQVAKNGSGE